ncbi:hypothetical protein [Micromonospora echinospora]
MDIPPAITALARLDDVDRTSGTASSPPRSTPYPTSSGRSPPAGPRRSGR